MPEEEKVEVKGKPIPVIIIYGRENCDVCNRFKKRIDELGFKYEFKNFDDVTKFNNNWKTNGSVDILAAYYSINDGHLPVIVIDGQYHTFASAINHLKDIKNG
jgi:glutaredoxin